MPRCGVPVVCCWSNSLCPNSVGNTLKKEEPVLVTDPQWVALAETAGTGATVFGILNPASGPGTVTDETYPEAIDVVVTAGAKVGSLINEGVFHTWGCLLVRRPSAVEHSSSAPSPLCVERCTAAYMRTTSLQGWRHAFSRVFCHALLLPAWFEPAEAPVLVPCDIHPSPHIPGSEGACRRLFARMLSSLMAHTIWSFVSSSAESRAQVCGGEQTRVLFL